MSGRVRMLLGVRRVRERDALSSSLVSLGHEVSLADTGAELLELARVHPPHLVIVDHELLAEEDGRLASHLREQLPGVPLLVLPAAGVAETIPNAPEGDETMPPQRILAAVERVLGAWDPAPNRSPRRRARLDPFVGDGPAIRQLAEEARQALASESPILIEGPTGSGKGVLASWLHRHGPRAQEAFVDLNCAGFSRELMDSELFGHERGAFTGAVSSKPGLLEVADQGTLFLDEIGDMDVVVQGKLLKVIEEKRFRRVGETRERSVNVRVIAATHHDLLQQVSEGRFRADLYYRIRVLRLTTPALRTRGADILALARHILRPLALELGRAEPAFSPEAERLLLEYAWPGNLREMRNELERAILASPDDTIERHHLRLESNGAPATRSEGTGGTLAQFERAYIERVLQEEQRVELAAQRLGIPRSTLYQKLRALGIALPR